VIAHAAVTPNSTFATNAMGTTVSVSRMACRVSGSRNRFSKYAPTPAANASTKTFATGITIRTVTASSAMVVRL
jgi:hypothetical protein